MSNFSINLLANANTAQAAASIKALQIQVDELNDNLLAMGRAPAGTVNPGMFSKMQKEVSKYSNTARLAAQSTGLWEAAQVHVRSATDEYTESLQRQRVSMGKWQKSQKLAMNAYKEQLRLQSAVAHQLPLQGPGGKQVYDVYTPKQYNKALDTMSQRIGFARENLKSFSTQMVNWGKNTQWAGRQLMVGFTLPVVAFGAAAAVAGYQVDKELTRIAKVYDTTTQAVTGDMQSMMAVDKELAQVREAGVETAKRAAAEYGASATDTLSIQAELAATGKKGAALQKTTTEVTRIATLGELDRQTAIDATIALQSIFRMSNAELTKSFNYMNAIENATSLQTQDFATAIPIAANSVKAFGGDIKELGVLLVAMKERGIGASEGANALKATMQRLSRPSKQIREEFQAITGKSITDIVETSDSLSEVFTKIGDITRTLSAVDKRKVYAGLFGGWQVTRMTAMVEGMQDIKNGVGQAGKAFKIAGQDAGTWANVADAEMERLRKSVSFKFKAAFESLKLQMADAGAPFLTVASTLLNVISKIVKGFNSLGKPMKILLSLPVVLLAIAGPLIMITGLFANFAGNILKFGVTLTKGLGNMELLNRESAISKKASELAAAGFMDQAGAVNQLTEGVANLTTHFELLALAMAEATGVPAANMPVIGAYGMTQKDLEKNMITRNPSGQFVHAIPHPMAGQTVSPTGMQNIAVSNQLQKEGVVDTREQVKNTEKIKRNWAGTAANVGMAVVAMGMLKNIADGGEQSFLNIAMATALFAPALGGAIGGLGRMSKWIFEAEDGIVNAANGTTKWAVAGNKVKSGFGSFLSRGTELLNPWVVGLTAVVGIVIGIKEASERALERQQRLTGSAKDWADEVGAAYTGYKKLSGLPMHGETTSTMYMKGQDFAKTKFGGDVTKEMNTYSPGAGQNLFAITEYNKMLATTDMTAEQAKENIELMFYAASKDPYKAQAAFESFSKSLEKNQGKVLDSAKGMRGLGDSMNELADIDTAVDQALSDAKSSVEDQLKHEDMGFLGMKMFYKVPGAYIENWGKDEEKIAEEKGKNIAAAIAAGMASLKSPFDKSKFFASFQTQFMSQWEGVYKKMDGDLKDALAKGGITTGKQLQQAISDFGSMDIGSWIHQYGEKGTSGQGQVNAIRDAMGSGGVERMVGLQKSITKELAAQGIISDKTKSLWDAQLGDGYRLLDIDKKSLEYRFSQIVQRGRLTKSQQLEQLNVMRVNAGLAETTNLADGFNEKVTTANSGLETGNRILDARARKQAEINRLMALVTPKVAADAMKDNMAGLQQQMADSEMNRFESRMQSAMDAVEAAGQRRMDAFDKRAENAQSALDRRQEAAQNALENRQDRQTEALDRRQERRHKRIEKAYDDRIKAVDKTIKAEEDAEKIRQRIFDAESKRLDRWAEMANRNIDFNVAMNSGNLDEAAKIRNEGVAAVSQWALDDSNDAGGKRSDKRIEALNNHKDNIEKAKTAELDAISKVEEAEKKSLKRRQDAEKKALDHRLDREKKALQDSLDMQKKSLENSIDANKKAEQAKWESRRNYLEKSLQDFTRYIAKDAKDLQKHIKLWKREHKGLSNDTREQFRISTNKINDYLVTRMKQSRRAIVNELDWAQSGAQMAKKMIQGAFGMNLKQFRRWMVTGEYPKNPDSGKKTDPTKSVQGTHYANNPEKYSHTGGWAGNAGSARNGVARTNPLHPSEIPVTLRKKEFVVNEDAAQQHGPLLEAINSGKALSGRTPNNSGARGTDAPRGKNQGGFTTGTGAGMALGFSGLLLAAASQAILGGIRKGAERTVAAQAAASSGTYGMTKSREFSGIGLSAEQIRNAITIANTGSKMGASPRDIRIALITAMQESTLRNLPDGDRDSVGLFQQRNAWGSFAERTNPAASARMFFRGGHQGQRGLFDFPDRDQMGMGAAAQAVQVSAYPGAYTKWIPMANALYSAINKGTAGISGYVPGSGGKHRPIPQPVSNGIHDSYTGFPAVDMAAPVGTKVHAVADGTITRSSDLKGYEPRNSVQNGYYSYGRVIQQSVPGGEVLYAHLSQRAVHKGQRVKGGAVIGATGNTGHSTGPHLHFGAKGITPYAFLREGGIVKQDGTMSILHKDEGVLTAPLTQQLHDGIGGISDAGQVLAEIRRAGLSQGAYDTSRVGDVSGYHYGIDKAASGKDSGKKAALKIGTYNVLFSSKNKATASDIDRLMKKTDLLNLTEYVGKKRALDKHLRDKGWGVYGKEGPGRDTAIAYNKQKFSLLRGGEWKMNNAAPHGRLSGGNYRPHYATYARMRDKRSGREFWDASIHTIAHSRRHKAAIPVQLEQYARLKELNKKLRKSGPVFFGGDFNPSKMDVGKMMRLIGMTSGRAQTKRQHGKNTVMDHVLFNKGQSRIANQRVIRNGLSSDHPAYLAGFNIPGLSRGGFTLNDGIARLHKKETVLTAPLSEKLNLGIDKLAQGTDATYNLHMYGFGANVNTDVLADKVMRRMRRQERRLGTSRSTRSW